MDINRLTQKAQEAFSSAQSIAYAREHQEIDAEHLVYAFLEQEKGLIPSILQRMNVNVSQLKQDVDQILNKRPRVSGPGSDAQNIHVTTRVNKALAQAEMLAKKMQDEYISVEHIFHEIIGPNPSGLLGDVFRKHGIDQARFMKATEELRGPHRITSPNPEETFEALAKYGRDLVEAAGKGKLDPVIGRDQEIRRTIRILSRRTKNNPVLIGATAVCWRRQRTPPILCVSG